jgi:hypothetical protein
MAPNPFNEYANAIASREQGLRGEAANIANMSGSMDNINRSEVPALGALANQQAQAGALSTIRESSSKASAKRMPKYVSAYRNYLQWRYPNRYGGGGGTDYTNTNTGGNSYNVPDLPAITGIPSFDYPKDTGSK